MRRLREFSNEDFYMRIRESINGEEYGGFIDFESDDDLKERVLKNDYKKIYSLRDISKWIRYGLNNGLISRGGSKEEIEGVLKWIDLLNKNRNIEL